MADQTTHMKIKSKRRKKKKILILAANPKTTERLEFDKEFREIIDSLERSFKRNQFKIVSQMAVRPRDLRRAISEEKPNIVHFIGHGEETGIIVEDEQGYPALVSSEALSDLFALYSDQVECVILSACDTASHAEFISKHIDYAIGMKGKITDKAAIEFAIGFYDSLDEGNAYELAFNKGCNAVHLVFPQQSMHLIPILKKKPSLNKLKNPSESTSETTSSSNTREKPRGKNAADRKSKYILYLKLIIALISLVTALLSLYLVVSRNTDHSKPNEEDYIREKTPVQPPSVQSPLEKFVKDSSESGKHKVQPQVNTRNCLQPATVADLRENLLIEIWAKGLLAKLGEANKYYNTGSPGGEDTSLTHFRDVTRELSPGVWRTFPLLNDADNDFREKHNNDALLKYKKFFDEVLSDIEQERVIVCLSVSSNKGAPENNNKEHLCLTSTGWNETGYWIKFKNDSIVWQEYHRICLKIDFDENTTFDQEVMLKLQLNNTMLCKTDSNVIQLGGNSKDLYLKKSKGRFYYQFKNSDLDNDNEIQITLNKGKWQNFCIDLALIKKNQN